MEQRDRWGFSGVCTSASQLRSIFGCVLGRKTIVVHKDSSFLEREIVVVAFLLNWRSVNRCVDIYDLSLTRSSFRIQLEKLQCGRRASLKYSRMGADQRVQGLSE